MEDGSHRICQSKENYLHVHLELPDNHTHSYHVFQAEIDQSNDEGVHVVRKRILSKQRNSKGQIVSLVWHDLEFMLRLT